MPKNPSTHIAPQQVVPPDGWTQKNALGFLGFDSTPAGRLVRLADVVRWLEDARCLPRSDAIQAVIDALPEDVMGWLYQIKQGAKAQLVQPNCTFGQATEQSITKDKEDQRQINAQRQWEAENKATWRHSSSRFGVSLGIVNGMVGTTKVDPVPVMPGRPALAQYLGKWVSVKPERTIKGNPIDTLDSKPDLIAYLAIPHAKAAEVWGWGRAADVVPLSTGIAADAVKSVAVVRVRDKGSDWTQTQESQLLQDFKDALGGSNQKKYEAVSKLWDIGVGSVKKQLATIKKRNKKAGPMGAMATTLKG
jgi:hypothetical protein